MINYGLYALVVPYVVLALNYVLSEVSDYHSSPVFILQDRDQKENLIYLGGFCNCKAKGMTFSSRRVKRQKV